MTDEEVTLLMRRLDEQMHGDLADGIAGCFAHMKDHVMQFRLVQGGAKKLDIGEACRTLVRDRPGAEVVDILCALILRNATLTRALHRAVDAHPADWTEK